MLRNRSRLGLIDTAYAARIAQLVERAGLPVRGPALGVERYIELMRVDKKAEAGQTRFVLIDGQGSARLSRAPAALVAAVIEQHTG